MRDASGLGPRYDDPATGTGQSCRIKALLSLIGSLEGFHNGFDWNALFSAICSAVMNCGMGAMCTALGNILDVTSPIVGCVAGAICSITGSVLSDMCTVLTDCPGKNNVPKMLCNILLAAASGWASGGVPAFGGPLARLISGGGSLFCYYLYGGHHTPLF